MYTSTHDTIKKVLLLLTKQTRRLLQDLKNPDDYYFEEKMNSLNYLEYVIKLLLGDEEHTPSQEAWDMGMQIINDLKAEGHIKTNQFPIFVDMRIGKKSEEHIQAHEEHDTILSSQVGSLEELEEEVPVIEKKTKTKKIKT